MRHIAVRDLGTIPCKEAYRLQRDAVAKIQNGGAEDVLFLLEHPHVVTRGRNASDSTLLADPALLAAKGVALVETDRGGDITYHGPGQLVGYPVLGLEPARRDIRRYVTDLEQVIMNTLADFSIESRRDGAHRGVWTRNGKIASIGVRISRWVTSHGFALNVGTDLSFFSLIVPCGIKDCRMTSMALEVGHPIDMARVKDEIAHQFGRVFDRKLLSPRMDAAVIEKEAV